MPPIISIFLGTTAYFNGIFNMNKVKDVLLYIKRDCNYYRNRPENKILEYYKSQGKRITRYYAIYVYATLLAYLTLPTISLVTDLIAPSNHSQEKSFLFELDYGIDKHRYFYYLTAHSYLGTAMIANLMASCDIMYMLYAQHAYALFAIVSYQLKTLQILRTSGLINVQDNNCSFEQCKNADLFLREEKKIYQKLFRCIKEHQNAIEYSNLLDSLFAKSILVQLFFNVLTLSITGVETVLKLGNISEMTRFGPFMFFQVARIFFLCFPGQRLMNHSEQVYTAACEVMWYMLPKNSHNLYKFLLARSLKPSKITAFKMAPMTMETFLSIIQVAMSYFTVLLSTT
ncbi:odorant receptor 10 [Xylocopa sonorina]|uniref:odorant receptor 10 n=1 Tax=Xylocopa sonorina TaxID=1818115 RepID=UPI00403AE698